MPCKQTILKNGEIIGGITIEPKPSMDNIINIGYIIICKEKQKKGNGKNIIALLFCLDPKVTKITAMPIENSIRFPDSLRFWKKMGKENHHTGNIEIDREEFIKMFFNE
ncbi:Uncharacterised protein [uncultured archaeon]|nr:Uncharacterised protein [uncultured archaeon]